ncbi:MAG TPA: ParB/RepB/Spo0J family partition protein [Pyrinomonadaceae bacterium]|jgi:ParB family chromosome partitioning protein|nr:ParB/RepB/Spo0J family partition protein [Pyrinomonadaceae bacterium]
MNRKALGRGLGALLGSDQTINVGQESLEIDLDSIDSSPEQPRARFDEAALERLANSIQEHGVVQPVIVRRRGLRYELIAGERRWRAAQKAGLRKIPVVVREVQDHELLEIALTENVQREDLNPIEEALAYQKLIERVGLTQEAVAIKFGRDRSYITNYLRLLRLPNDVQRLVEEGRLSTGHARTVLGLPHEDQQRRAARQVIEKGLSVRATEALVKKTLSRDTDRGTQPRPVVNDPNVRAAETKLRRLLGTQVRILQGAVDGPGRIEIAFFNTRDLDRIYAALIKSSSEM